MKPQRLQWTPELVQKFWDGIAQTELVQFSFAKQAGPSLLVAIDHLLPRDGVIIDFGAGDGHLVRMMCERGLRAAAYEPSTARTAHLRARLADVDGFEGIVGPGVQRSFDVVIMSEVIEHVLDEELDSTLGRLAGLTKPGGILIVTTPNNENLELGMAYCPLSNMLFHRWQHVRSFTKESLAELLKRFGFEEVATHRLGFDPQVFLPWDAHRTTRSVGSKEGSNLPDYIAKLRRNESVCIGSESNIMYIGRRSTL
jgi:2-polyprenyl-3-methyl-5-hydroxy-6-metoxy-1,4-benzoquinol methylase